MIKTATLLLFYLSSLLIGLSHDMPIALFKLSEKNGHTAFHITVDTEDIQKVLLSTSTPLGLNELNEYLNNHISIALDHRTIDFDISAFEIKDDHIHISANIDQSITDYQNISVRNTCLLEIDNQSNIVQLEYQGKVRDFRMTKDRQEIMVVL